MGSSYSDFTGALEHAAVSPAASGANELVAAPGANKKLRIHGYRLTASAAIQARFYAGTISTPLSGILYVGANGAIGEPISGFPAFDLPANTAFGVDLDGATACGGYVKYRTISTQNS